MNELMKPEIQTVNGLDCYEKDDVVFLNLEQAARGLGFTDEKKGTEYVRWARVDGYLRDLKVFATCGERPDFIPENVFYRLAMKAKNETAERFQAWVADEVIPSIRKHGAYMTPDTLENMIASPDFGIRLLTALKEEQERSRALKQDNDALTAKIEADAPKVLYADTVAGAKTGMLIREFCKFLREQGLNIGEKRMFADHRERGFLIKAEGRDRNKPTQRAMELGLFSVKETAVSKPSGETFTKTTPLLTGKGRQYLTKLYLSGKEATQ